MPTFDFLPLLWWGLPFAAAPVIIHLINLLRHRKVPWAAMEFLVASQRKYRTRVLLKQILLLLLRVAAVLGIVLALAQPRWKTALGRMLGGARTAHVVLLEARGQGRQVLRRDHREVDGIRGGHGQRLGSLALEHEDRSAQARRPELEGLIQGGHTEAVDARGLEGAGDRTCAVAIGVRLHHREEAQAPHCAPEAGVVPHQLPEVHMRRQCSSGRRQKGGGIPWGAVEGHDKSVAESPHDRRGNPGLHGGMRASGAGMG